MCVCVSLCESESAFVCARACACMCLMSVFETHLKAFIGSIDTFTSFQDKDKRSINDDTAIY